jgi:uncharacterized membrane protein
VVALLVGVVALIVGFTVLAMALALEGLRGNISVGGVVIIGPVPIVLGGGPYSELLTLLATILAIIVALLFLLHYVYVLRSQRR